LGKRKAGNLNDFLLGETVNVKLWLTYWLYKLELNKIAAQWPAKAVA